jgi:pectate lyase
MARYPLVSIPQAVVTAIVAGSPAIVWAQSIPAFPGADGAAGTVSGGRGGIVYHVTKLDASFSDSAPGTLRYGLNNANFPAGPRTIVFDVSGTIHLGRVVSGWDGNGNGWDTQSRFTIPANITLAGQTAPGPIIIMGGVTKPGTNNIIRNITFAPGYGNRNFYEPGDIAPSAGDFPDSYVYDALDISTTNVMVDHVTTVYATDETISANELANNITIQYSTIAQGQNYPQNDAEGSGLDYTGHALGSLLQGGSNAKFSVHHNLYAHLKGRLPRVGSEVGTGAHNDFRNNVFYNWLGTAGAGASNQPSFNKFVGNFYLAGPGGDNPVGGASTLTTNSAGGTGIFGGGANVYQSGNIKDTNKNGSAANGVAIVNGDFGSATHVADASFSIPYFGVTDTATVAFNRVLEYAGARWWEQAAIDERLMSEVLTGGGKIVAWADNPFSSDPSEGVEWRAMRNLPTVHRPAGFDTDQDGMPDAWESSLGLDPLAANNNADFDSDGYTDLEEYINELGEWPAPRPIVFAPPGGTGRYALINNWDIRWQPSRYDTARITNGATAHVDAIGQHAGVLLVGDGGPGALALDAGWLRVHQLLRVRETGNLQFNGGAIDLATGAAIFDYSTTSPLGDLSAQLASGRAGGAWNGPGIHSSAAAAMPGTSIGIVEASDLGVSSFQGQSVDGTTVLMRWTFTGDADLNGMVDVGDLGRLASNWQSAGTWFDGDFDYSGFIDVSDLGILASNWQAGVGSPLGPSLSDALAALGLPGVAVPEPGMLAAPGLLAGLLKRPARARRPRRE